MLWQARLRSRMADRLLALVFWLDPSRPVVLPHEDGGRMWTVWLLGRRLAHVSEGDMRDPDLTWRPRFRS